MGFIGYIGYIVLALLILMLMVTIHEFGHYIAGKIFKFKINEFSIGFGKAIYSKKLKNGELFSIRVVPLGGYCAFEGEDEDENATDSEKAFNKEAWWKRLIVLFNGAFFNLVSAVIFSFILLVSVGSGVPVINNVVATNGNESVLKTGDVVISVAGEEPSFLNGGLSGLLSGYKAGDDISLVVRRDGQEIPLTVSKYLNYYVAENGKYVLVDGDYVDYDPDDATMVDLPRYDVSTILGVTTYYYRYNAGEALVKCVPYTFNMAVECLEVLGGLFTGAVGLDSVGGPVTTISTIATAAQTNYLNILLLLPLIAVNLGVFNLLPIPALDGARMVFVLIEGIFRKPVPRNIEAYIHSAGILLLFGFIILVDVLQIFVF